MAVIREDRNAAFWNPIANEPGTRELLGPSDDTIDLTGVLAFPLTVPLAAEGGGFIFGQHEAGRYELHTIFRKGARGRAVLDAFAEAARWMFTRTDATEIVTKTADSNRPAALMAKLAGFRPLFKRANAAWDGTGFTYYAMTFDEWLGLDPAIRAEGQAFHEMLEAAKAASGSPLPTHPDDEAHDRAAGAAALMAKHGQAAKAVWLYSRWAALAGYQTIDLIEKEPPMIDVRDAVLTVVDGQLEVVECR